MNLWEKFSELVFRDFKYLESEFGFVCKSSKPPFITYESDRVKLSIFYDTSRRCELDLRVRKLGDDPRKTYSLGIGTLIRLNGGKANEGYLSPFPANEESLKVEVQRLAELLKTYGLNVLKGDVRDFGRMEQLEQELAKKFGPKKS